MPFLADFGDTLIKGASYLHMLGAMYEVRTISYVILSAVVIKVRNERFHSAFAIFAAVFEILLIFRSYLTVPSLS